MEMKDSGKRQTFTTGAVRDTDDDKPRPDLVSPFMLERLGFWMKSGADKYGENNWQKGIPISRCISSLYRHLIRYMQGDHSEDHLMGIIANATFVAHYEEMVRRGVLPPSLLDMPKYRRPSSYYEPNIIATTDGPKIKFNPHDQRAVGSQLSSGLSEAVDHCRRIEHSEHEPDGMQRPYVAGAQAKKQE